MNDRSRQIVDQILASDQIDRTEMLRLELATGEQLLSRIAPIPGAVGVLVYDGAAVRKLIEAGMIPQTR